MGRDLFGLSGRVALVTGGSKGLGLAMARGLAGAGADVVISSRHGDELEAAAGSIRAEAGARVACAVADLARRDEADRLADEAARAFGRVDILVNNAGGNTPQPIDELRDDDWDRLLELNLNACMRLTRALAPGMKERRWGRIIQVSSILGLTSATGRGAYSASKSGLIGLTRAFANDLGPFGITVNSLAPGPFLTELTERNFSDEQKAAFAQKTALGRWGRPEELIGPALLLASEAGAYITGATLVVDGGTLARLF